MFTSKTLLFLTLLVALFVASSAQSCPLFANCDDCVGEGSGSCGWCESTSECLAGNAVGPGGVAANCTEWFYDNCLAVDCFRFTSCSTCLRDPFCGWCQTTSTCVEGLRTGPVTGSCSDYIFDRSSCPSTSTTGRRTTTTGRRATSSSTGRRATSSSTSGRRATSSASTTGSQATSSTTGRQATSSSTSGRQATSSSTGRQATSSSTGRRATSSTSGRRATSSSTGRRATSTGGRRATSTSGRRASSSTGGGSSVSTTSSTISSSTTGVASSGAAFSVNSASFLVAVGVVVIALVNLLF